MGREPDMRSFLLQPARWRAAAARIGLPPGFRRRLEDSARELLARPDRLADLERCAAEMFGDGEWPQENWRDTPRDGSAGECCFLVWPLLRRLPALLSFYKERGIPDQVLNDTLADLPRWIAAYRERHGRDGFAEAGWLRRHFRGTVFALGRLQFERTAHPHPLAVLRNRNDGRIELVAAADGILVTADGLFADSEGAAGKETLVLRYREENGEVREAHPVLPGGRIARHAGHFAPGAWERMLAPGDPVLAVHIPAGEPLAFEACRDSFRQAAQFFPRHFGDEPPPRAATCCSWLLYPGLAEMLPPEANIVRFQRQFRLFPLPGATADQTYERVFPAGGRATTEQDCRTTLQKRLLAHIRAGGTPLITGGLVPPPFDAWGRNDPPTAPASGRPPAT